MTDSVYDLPNRPVRAVVAFFEGDTSGEARVRGPVVTTITRKGNRIEAAELPCPASTGVPGTHLHVGFDDEGTLAAGVMVLGLVGRRETEAGALRRLGPTMPDIAAIWYQECHRRKMDYGSRLQSLQPDDDLAGFFDTMGPEAFTLRHSPSPYM